MEQKKTILTDAGKQELIDELKNLKDVVKPDVLARLQEARAQGDLSENADYDAARNDQGRVEARIREIEYLLKNCVVIDGDESTDVLHIGQYVEILKVGDSVSKTYQIVGENEADPMNGKISNESILAKSLLGKPVSLNPITIAIAKPYQVIIKSIKKTGN